MSNERGTAHRFGKTVLVYFLGTVASRLVGFALLPVYTRLMTPSQYGEYDLWFTICAFLAPVAFFQSWDGVYRFFFQHNDRDAVVTNGLVLMAWGSLVYTCAMAVALAALHSPAPMATFLFGLSTAAQYFLGYLARAQLKNTLFASSGLLNSTLAALISVGLLATTELGTAAIFIGLTVGNVAQSVLISASVKPTSYFKSTAVDHPLQRALLRFSLPLCLASVAYWLLSGFTRLALVRLDGMEANGLFAVADRFAFAMTLLSTVVMYAWQEFLYTDQDSPAAQERRDEGIRIILTAVLLTSAGTLLLVAAVFHWVVSDAFQEAYRLVPLTILSATMNTLSGILGAIFMATHKTRHLLTTTAVAAGVNVALCFVLIPRFGAAGGAASLLTAFTLMTVLRVAIVGGGENVRWTSGASLVGLVLLCMSVWAFWLNSPGLEIALAATVAAAVASNVTRLARQRSASRV